MELEGWVVVYRRPDLEEDCYAGAFETEEAAWAYAEGLPKDRTILRVEWGRLELRPRD